MSSNSLCVSCTCANHSILPRQEAAALARRRKLEVVSRATSNLAQGIFILRIACLLGLDYRLWASRPPVGRRQRAPANRMSGMCMYLCVWMWFVDDEVVQSGDVCTGARKRYNHTLSRIISHRVGVMCYDVQGSDLEQGALDRKTVARVPGCRMALGHRWGGWSGSLAHHAALRWFALAFFGDDGTVVTMSVGSEAEGAKERRARQRSGRFPGAGPDSML